MKSAILSRPQLRAALALLATGSGMIDRRSTLPILANAALVCRDDGSAVLVGTDQDIIASVGLDGAVLDTDFAMTMPAHKFLELEKKAPASDFVTIDATTILSETKRMSGGIEVIDVKDNSTASIDFESVRVTMQATSLSDPHTRRLFTPHIEGDIHANFSLPAEVLLDALERVSFAISTEETRYYLNGIYMHVAIVDGQRWLRFVATDGHRLARYQIAAPVGSGPSQYEDGGWGAIIPLKTVAFLQKLLKTKSAPESVSILVNTVKARFTVGNVDVVAKLIDGTFPDYARVIPMNNSRHASVNRDRLIKAIEAVSAVAAGRGRTVRLEFDGDLIMLEVNNPELGKAEASVPCTVEGGGTAIGFNARYALDVLETVKGDEVVIDLEDAGSPAVFRNRDDEAALFILMPMRV